MPTNPPRAKNTAQQPVFSPANDKDESTVDKSADTSTSDTDSHSFDVEPSNVELRDEDAVNTEDPYSEERERYNTRLDALELDRDDTTDRVGALELVVQSLCDTVLGKGVMPVLRTNEGVDPR